MSESISTLREIYIKFQALFLFAVAGKTGKKGHLFSSKRWPGGQSN
jgi:hypothetical protein